MFRHNAKGGPMTMDDKYFDRAVGKAVAAETAPD